MNQRQAFFVQARSDFEAFERLRATDLPACHWLHYLQMATEKLAKAVRLSPQGGVQFKSSHVAFSKLTHVLRSQPRMPTAMKMNSATYRQFIDGSAPLRLAIEALSPAVAGSQPNAEYPWQGRDAHGRARWFAPAEWEFDLEADLNTPAGYHTLKLLRILLRDFERLF